MFLIRIVFLTLIFTASFVGPYKAFFNSHSQKSFIEIMPGDSMHLVISRLTSESFLNKLFFRIYVNKNNIRLFQAGEYNITEMSIANAIDSFKKGNTITRFITINEGMNIFDLKGANIMSLVNSSQSAGYKEISWNGLNSSGSQLPAGLYFLTIQTEEYFNSKKMILLR